MAFLFLLTDLQLKRDSKGPGHRRWVDQELVKAPFHTCLSLTGKLVSIPPRPSPR